MKRLYIGGLSHTITKKDLKDRFGKFGEVEDVELRTRSDDEGVPYKTFSYININISDGDLKKCMTVLNKSKWKGGTLEIETARESFLHKLAEEREEAAELQPAAEDKKQKMLDSLSKAGVDNFNMKAAVPGTEVPGHKDWVVSKFGRVLPVLQIRCQQGSRARTMKYDPSKYSHNIRKLDRADADPPLTPVTQLTWEVQGGDDDISKKRRGEFSPYETPRSKKKKRRPDAVSPQRAEGGARFKRTVDHAEAHRFSNGNKPPTIKGPAQATGPRFTDWDLEPEEEIRKTVAAQSTSHDALRPEEVEEEEEEKEKEEDTLEVVRLDYLVKSGRKGGPDAKDENDYDSADTDELFASRKPPLPPLPPAQEMPTPPATALLSGNDGDRKRKMTKKSHAAEEEDESSDAEEEVASRKPSAIPSTRNQSKKMKVLPVVELPSSDSDEEDEDEEEEESESAECSSDSDYEAMFSNVTRLEISLADLQTLAEASQQTSEQETNLPAGSSERPAPKKGTTPEEILAALMEDSSEDEQQKKKKKKKKTKAGKNSTPLPAFQGTRALNEGAGEEEEEERRKRKGGEEEGRGGSEVKKQKLDSKATGPKINGRKVTDSESSEEEEEEADKVMKNMAEIASSSSSDEEETMKANQTVLTAKAAAAASSSSSSSSAEEDEQENAPDSESSSSEEEEEEEEEKQAPRVPLGAKEEEERQRKANVRRLAAVQQRQKEAEEHKKLIQGALANLDAPQAGAGKHTVFGSDDEGEDEEDEQQTTKKSKATLFQSGQSEDEAAEEKVRRKPPVPQLFGGSEDDEDEEDADEEEDGSRFDIRPQFEGRGGQKLMELQSRFGTDERFRMDSRFLEDDEDKGEESENKTSVTEEEEALEKERKKSLSILQSVLGGSQQASSGKTPAKTKTFRDVAALHYDPSKEEHTAFETKTDETKKESKAARRKKREEAQKLPEVSKEIYYDVSGDLKAVFGPTKDDNVAAAAVVTAAGGDEEANWDQEDEADEAEEAMEDEQPALQSTLLSADPGPENEEASVFKFSFFEDAEETGSGETAEYKVESIQAPKVSWQQDQRFQDSSDEEEEEKAVEEEEEEQSNLVAGTIEEETSSKTDRFFFFLGDSRLAEGPRSFCRPSHLEEQREQWEERRNELREEYRKKHKDARRKLRSSLKT